MQRPSSFFLLILGVGFILRPARAAQPVSESHLPVVWKSGSGARASFLCRIRRGMRHAGGRNPSRTGRSSSVKSYRSTCRISPPEHAQRHGGRGPPLQQPRRRGPWLYYRCAGAGARDVGRLCPGLCRRCLRCNVEFIEPVSDQQSDDSAHDEHHRDTDSLRHLQLQQQREHDARRVRSLLCVEFRRRNDCHRCNGYASLHGIRHLPGCPHDYRQRGCESKRHQDPGGGRRSSAAASVAPGYRGASRFVDKVCDQLSVRHRSGVPVLVQPGVRHQAEPRVRDELDGRAWRRSIR